MKSLLPEFVDALVKMVLQIEDTGRIWSDDQTVDEIADQDVLESAVEWAKTEMVNIIREKIPDLARAELETYTYQVVVRADRELGQYLLDKILTMTTVYGSERRPGRQIRAAIKDKGTGEIVKEAFF